MAKNHKHKQKGVRKMRRNLVAKYSREYNKSTTQKDKKKESKRGYKKHQKVEE